MTQASGLRLVALKCRKCSSLLDADPKDVVYYCNNCGTGYELINEKDELVALDIDFALPKKAVDAEAEYYPFWVFNADIKINERDASGTLSSVVDFIKGKITGGPKPIEKFYVPGFETPMENIKKLGLEFTRNQPDFDILKKDKLKGCIYSSRDAGKIADFIFLSMEAEKPDMLKGISYDLGLSSPKVIGIPFYRDGTGFIDGIFGIRI